MEFRVLKYFLTVANEESITAAAEALYLSQPTLSRQLRDLEDEIGKQLLIRGNKKTTLTEDGVLLRKRAQEIMDLMNKTESELRQSDDSISGDIWIGGGESEGMRFIARAVHSMQKNFPNIQVNLISANSSDIFERLEKGLVDFGVGVGDIDLSRYETIELPVVHTSGVLMRKDSPLANRAAITPDDLQGIPIITPRNEEAQRWYAAWMGKPFETLDVVASFNLIYNAAFLVEEGVGYALCMDRLINISDDHPLLFVPHDPPMNFGIKIAWKRHQVFSKASLKFIETLKEIIIHYKEIAT